MIFQDFYCSESAAASYDNGHPVKIALSILAGGDMKNKEKKNKSK
jgi:hypothetical protein